jgi:hypothetical protein
MKWFMKYYKWVKVDSNPSFTLTEYNLLDENKELIIV